MISVSSYIRSPSAREMPISSAITADGSRPAMSRTKSHSPASTTSSMISPASSVMRSVSSWAFFGVKPRLTSSLKRSCWGGSIDSIIWRCAASHSSPSGSASITPLAAELNSPG